MVMQFDQIPDQQTAPPAPQHFDSLPDDRGDIGMLRSIWEGFKSGVTGGWAPQISGAMTASGLETALPYLSDAQLAEVQKSGGVMGVYAQARDQARTEAKAAQGAHPYAYGGGEIAGAVVPMLVAPEAKTVGEMLKQGAKIGAGYGAVSGAAEATEKGSAADIARGGAGGAVTGAVGGTVGALLGVGANKVGRVAYDNLGRPIVSTVRGLISPEAEAARRVGGALNLDYPQVAAGTAPGLTPGQFVAAKAAGDPVMLADLGGENTRALVRSAANTSPEGRAMIANAAAERFADQGERVGGTIRSLAGGANVTKTRAQLLAQYDAERVPAYKEAFAQPEAQQMWDDGLEQIMQAPVVQQATRGAIVTAKNEAAKMGLTPPPNPFVTDETGRLTLGAAPDGSRLLPNLQFWDVVKKNLDAIGSPEAQFWAKTLRTRLDDMVPEYGEARGIASSYFGGRDAIEDGELAATRKIDREVLRQQVRGMSKAERALFQEGYASALARKVEETPDRNDALRQVYQSAPARERMNIVFGPQAADIMEPRVHLETVFNAVRNALGNSTTARQLIEAGLAGGSLGAVLSGGDPTKIAEYGLAGVGARRLAPEAAMTAVRTAVGYVNRNMAKEVARLLTSNDPQDLMRGLRMAANNQRVGNALRELAGRVGTIGGIAPARPLAGLQGPGLLNAQEDQQDVPRPPGQ